VSDEAAAPPVDPGSLLTSRSYRGLLVVAAVIGVVVSLASWCFLEAIHGIQQWAFKDLPSGLGFDTVPTWWPLPVLGVAGVIIAFAVARLPGGGGHKPAEGFKAGPPTTPIQLPGVLLAALASIGLGMVLGPEAPLIALAGGLAILSIRLAKKDAPQQVYALMAAAASFAAISSLFGSPIVGAIIIIEAAGLGGATLPVILLPGLIAAGIGSLVFVGMGSMTGLSTSAYAIAPLSLPAYPTPTLGAICWVFVLAVLVAIVAFAIVQLGRRTEGFSSRRPFVVIPVAAIVVAVIAIAFQKITGEPVDLVLFSGQDTMNSLVNQAATLSLGTLALLIVFKGLAYGISLGSARGGPTFPAMFLGIVAGLLAAHLPGLSETPAVAALMGAATVAVLRLPLSSVTIAAFLSQASMGTTPLIIVAVVVAYLTVRLLDARFLSDANEAGPGTSVDGARTSGDPPSDQSRSDG
jgi:chloride channel protein, CIC family